MKRTLIATAAALALGFSGLAMANPCSDNSDSCNQSASSGSNGLTASATSDQTAGTGDNANEIASYASVSQDSFNKSSAVALTKLNGSVSGVGVTNIGNLAWNTGSAKGA